MNRTSDFFYHDVLNISAEQTELGGFYLPVLIAFAFSWVIVYLCVRNGIKTTGKIAYFTVLSPYFLLTILLIRVLTLEGSFKGILHFFIPDFYQLFSFKIWVEASTQAFFMFNLGQGIHITFARFRKDEAPIGRCSFW